LRRIPGILFAGVLFAQQEPSAKQLLDPSWINEGRRQYRLACGGCHGINGEGGRGPNLADGAMVRRAKNDRLFYSVRNGVAGTDMPGFPWEGEKVWQMVAFVRSLSAPAQFATLPGNAEAGAALFHGKGGCTGCHMIRGAGGFTGPDLTDAGATRTAKQLRESITNPNDRIAEGFESVSVIQADGSPLRGVAKNKNNYSIQLLEDRGKLHLLERASLKSVRFETTSAMPKPDLTAKEIEDIVAYLAKQSVRVEAKR